MSGSTLGASRGQKVAITTMILGGLAFVTGAIVYGRARRRHRGELGEVQSRTKNGSMTLTHHYDAEMPIQKRVEILQGLVWKGVRQPQMRELALAITGRGDREVTVGKRKFRVRGANCPARDGLCEAQAVYSWVKHNIRYTGDVAPVKMPNGAVEGIDLFQSPYRTVEFGGEDCDGHASLNATLLSLNGIPSKFRITAPKHGDWQHIYATAGLSKQNPTKWIALDTTLPGEDMFGIEAKFGRHIDFPA